MNNTQQRAWHEASRPRQSERGWQEVPSRPGLIGYWTGDGWDASVPPRHSEPVWVRAQPVALGALIALIAFLLLMRLTG